MVKEDDADNPGGGFPTRQSESLPLEGYSPGRWNSAQDCQGPDASSVIPRDPCCWIRLFQSYDLRHHHWDKGGHEPERRGNSAKRHSRRLTPLGAALCAQHKYLSRLSLCHERPRDRHAAEQRYERATLHSITSS